MNRNKALRFFLIFLFICSAGCFLYAGYHLLRITHQYHEAAGAYASLENSVVISTTAPPNLTAAPELATEDIPRLNEEQPEATEPPAADAAPFPVSVDFTALQAINNDISAWIYLPDSVINYPVVAPADNAFYLKHLFNGTENANGTLFIDCDNPTPFQTRNTIIYGHNMNDGSMFACINQYKKASYFEAHPLLYLCTLEENYVVEVIAAYITEAGSDIYQTEFSSGNEFLRIINEGCAKSAFQSGVVCTPEDRIITLSTCTYEFDDARFVLLGKLVAYHD